LTLGNHPGKAEMHNSLPVNGETADEITLTLTDASHLFNAPPVDPMSPSPAEALGVAGVEHLISRLHMDKKLLRMRKLVLVLPPEKIPEDGGERIMLALHRQAELRLAVQKRELRNTYRNGWRAMLIALGLLAICLAISSVFASDFTEGMRPLIRKTFEYGFEIIGWVIMWHPVDVIVFEPLMIRWRIKSLKTLAGMQVVVRADGAG
jgi:hypothetical protein